MSSKVATQGDGASSIGHMQTCIETLSGKMDRLITIQEKVLSRLDEMSQDISCIEKDMEDLKVDKEEIHILPKKVTQSQPAGKGMRETCQEMSSIMSAVNQRSEQQAEKLDGMEKLVLGMQQMISLIGETVKTSRVVELMFKGSAARKASKLKDIKGKMTIKRQSSADTITKNGKPTSTKSTTKGTPEKTPACDAPVPPKTSHKTKLHGPKHFLSLRKCGGLLKDGTEKPRLSLKGLKTQKKKKPPDAADTISLRKQALLLEEVQKLNRENAERSGHQVSPGLLDLEAGGTSEGPKLLDHLPEESKTPVAEEEDLSEGEKEKSKHVKEEKSKPDKKVVLKENKEAAAATTEAQKTETKSLKPSASHASQKDSIPASDDHKGASSSLGAEQDQTAEANASSKRRVNEEVIGTEDHKKSRVGDGAEKNEKVEEEKEKEEEESSEGWGIFKADGVEFRLELKELRERVEKKRMEENDRFTDDDELVERFLIDTGPPIAAPFSHRVVSTKPNQITNFYTINRQEILGGGRFGQVHKCIENSSGLTFAAKIIKGKSQKEKEVVKNEIQVMNQLDHTSLIQLYAAYESRSDIILVLEYVDGGELFDRIIDENYKLKELDAVVFIKQICEGLQHMHKMSILHLDLKPENIMCVSRVTNKVKIIDFGLARIYKPREKLKVNFGTPEFLAPEVINFDFVSFNTDMWSLGVIAYMLLSGLCPFLGDDDNETLNNILNCRWSFEEDEFIDTSDEAKEFITKCLVFNKSWRIGATEALRQPWLSDSVLHHRLHSRGSYRQEHDPIDFWKLTVGLQYEWIEKGLYRSTTSLKTMCRSRRASCIPPTDN